MNDHFKNLMLGLIYPAMAGTGIVLALVRIAQHNSLLDSVTDFSLWLGMLFVFFFCVSFIAISQFQAEKYTTKLFISDLFESICVFLLYHFAGCFSSTPIPARLSPIYITIAVVLVEQQIWRFFAKSKREPALAWARWIAIVLCIASAIQFHQFMAYNIAVLVVLYILTGVYAVTLCQRVKSAQS